MAFLLMLLATYGFKLLRFTEKSIIRYVYMYIDVYRCSVCNVLFSAFFFFFLSCFDCIIATSLTYNINVTQWKIPTIRVLTMDDFCNSTQTIYSNRFNQNSISVRVLWGGLFCLKRVYTTFFLALLYLFIWQCYVKWWWRWYSAWNWCPSRVKL